jgi:hypothetical protein
VLRGVGGPINGIAQVAGTGHKRDAWPPGLLAWSYDESSVCAVAVTRDRPADQRDAVSRTDRPGWPASISSRIDEYWRPDNRR